MTFVQKTSEYSVDEIDTRKKKQSNAMQCNKKIMQSHGVDGVSFFVYFCTNNNE